MVVHELIGRGVLVRFCQRTEGRRFGHAPALHDLQAVPVQEPLHQDAGDGGTAGGDTAQRGKVDGVALAVVPDVVPDSRDGHGDAGPLLLHQLSQWGGLEVLDRKHEVGAGEEA